MDKKLLPLRQLRFGNIDARYEVTSRNPKEVEHFRRSFVEPAGMNIDEFVEGHRFFVHGVKGAGKTSLLRFVQLRTSEAGALTKFISFATEISDAERTKISSISGIEVYEQEGVEVHNNSAVDVWMLFILRHIARIIEDHRLIFSTHRNITVFCQLMRKVYDREDSKGLLKWLADSCRTGQYKFKSKFFDASIKGKEAEEEREYPISYVVEQSLRLLKDLAWDVDKNIYMFFDEMNLSFASKASHKRDIILIRDLIIAIDRLNTYFVEEHKPIYIMAATRSEVLNALNAPTHEINKILADRGRELRWFSKNAGGEWPIIKLVESKIRASEILAGRTPVQSPIDSYFHREIFGYLVRDFIIEATWCNPRDLVLMFGEAVTNAAFNESVIGTAVISRVFENYSAAAWREKAEELSVEYAPQEIQGIKKILLNLGRHFKINGFEQSWNRKAETDQILTTMRGKYKAAKMLEDLYRIGVLGQSSRQPLDTEQSFTQHWTYRGDTSFDSSAWFVVHKALWPELRLGKIGDGNKRSS